MSGHQVKFSVSSNFLFPVGLQSQDGLEPLISGAKWGRSTSALLSQTLLLYTFPGIVLNGAVCLGGFILIISFLHEVTWLRIWSTPVQNNQSGDTPGTDLIDLRFWTG